MEFPKSLLEDTNVIKMAASKGITPTEYLQSILDGPQSPILENLESGPRMDTGPTVATQPALTTKPNPIFSSGNGSVNHSDLVRANGALNATEGDRSGAYQPWDYTMGAIADPLPDTQAVVVDASNQPPNPANGPYLARPVLDDEMSNSTVETLNPTYGPHTASPSLVDTTTPTNTTKTDPVLQTGQNGTTSRTPILSRGGKSMTGNARGSNRPQAYQTPMGESLIRIGGAMYSGALQGNGIGAATQEYGSIQDANRATQERVDQASEATRLAELRAKATGSKAGSAAATKAAAKNQKALDTVNDSLWGMQNGLDAIAASRAAGGNLTGLGGIFKGLFDGFTGDADANRRLTLERLKVNDALLRTAETKGAISNSEMSLFLKPAPTNFKDEDVWVDWIELRMEALGRVQTRLQGGVVLGPGERANNFGTYGSEGEFKFTPEMQAAFDKYKQ